MAAQVTRLVRPSLGVQAADEQEQRLLVDEGQVAANLLANAVNSSVLQASSIEKASAVAQQVGI